MNDNMTFEEAISYAIKLADSDINTTFHAHPGKWLEFKCSVQYDANNKSFNFLNMSLETP